MKRNLPDEIKTTSLRRLADKCLDFSTFKHSAKKWIKWYNIEKWTRRDLEDFYIKEK